MKRKYILKRLTVFIAKQDTVCARCHHHRTDEPYIKRVYSYTKGENRTEIVCWVCCHDEETTGLIAEKWPLAFDRTKEGPWYWLRWAEPIQSMLGLSDEV